MILVAVIRRHGISAKDIMALPEIKNSKLKLINTKRFMQYHGLLKKRRIPGAETVEAVCRQVDWKASSRSVIPEQADDSFLSKYTTVSGMREIVSCSKNRYKNCRYHGYWRLLGEAHRNVLPASSGKNF